MRGPVYELSTWRRTRYAAVGLAGEVDSHYRRYGIVWETLCSRGSATAAAAAARRLEPGRTKTVRDGEGVRAAERTIFHRGCEGSESIAPGFPRHRCRDPCGCVEAGTDRRV